ncbi:HNH endonuclease signature motif containing protein [Pelagibacterium sp.]|uniref:HNH endonuclease signature motif containing protein n=1 Tax=Pelagibacterium sp. TaxID=1967288 RepID=UPI0032ED90A8
MPSKPSRLCTCGRTIGPGTRCACQQIKDKAARARHDRTRPNSATRGYDGAWRRVRAEHLAEHPICEHPGCKQPSEEAHHVISVRKRPDLRLDKRNLMALCKSHHSQVTARMQGFAKRR